MNRLILALAALTASAFASPKPITVGQVLITSGNANPVAALDSVKRWISDGNIQTKIDVRDLRDELAKNAETERPQGIKLEAKLGAYRQPKADTTGFGKTVKAFSDLLSEAVPLSAKLPIKVSLSQEAKGRVVDYDFDVLLAGLIKFVDLGKDGE